MRHTFSLVILALTGLLATTACEAQRDFERGMEAMLDGDFAIAYCQWKPLADRGHAESQYHIGWLYANGNGLNLDMGQAVEWWRRAADQGHMDAQFAVALAYTTGEGLEKDMDRAAEWYLRAADLGHEDARDILKRLLAKERDVFLEKHPGLMRRDWFSEPGKVLGDRINVRGGPGKNHKVVKTATPDDRLKIFTQRGGWVMVGYEEEGELRIGWIYNTLVEAINDKAD